ncbi:MAG: glutamine--fructose-6-phosphate aminotransferase [isomerizing] [Candidatus Parcubacteria bacterium]|nr:MAG: glutamine--fructose-6-phosphate aminotransferase [isomerizing] [Candidatus Parcubacteria bacterium]
MCGIAGWVGPTAPETLEERLLRLLERLEYRGYDSAGLWTPNVGLVRCVGEVRCLRDRVVALLANKKEQERARRQSAHYGIAHTRWATHGKVLLRNTHPHKGCRGRVLIVHNGVIENAQELRARHPCRYHSDTDTEVVAHYVEALWQTGESLESALRKAVALLQGSFAIAAVSPHEPEQIVVARRGSPLVVARGKAWCAVASDALALAPFARFVSVIPEDSVLTLTKGSVVKNDKAARLPREAVRTEHGGKTRRQSDARRPHQMYQEILESPDAWRNAVRSVAEALRGNERLRHLLARSSPLVWFPAACGSAWHAAQIAAPWFVRSGDLLAPTAAREAARVIGSVDLPRVVLAVSQSGETADTREVVRYAKEAEVPTVGVVNVVPSSLAREVDILIPMGAGQEVSVASTKAVVGQVGAMVALAHARAAERRARGQAATRGLRNLASVSRHLSRFLREQQQPLAKMGKMLSRYAAVFFIGSSAGEAIAREGALKFKEITYLFAEGMHAAELKHGPLAVIDRKTPVVVIVLSSEDTLTLTNAHEAQSRGAPLYLIAPVNIAKEMRDAADAFVPLPATTELSAVACALTAVHCVAYEAARTLHRPIDKPRNLAKSVTVQ